MTTSELTLICIKLANLLHILTTQDSLESATVDEGDVYTTLAEMLGIGIRQNEPNQLCLDVLSTIPEILCKLENERLLNPYFTSEHIVTVHQ
jgi:hypothetical protein